MEPTTELTRRYVESADGTPIAYWSSGAGPPLVLVHGAMSDHRRWRIRPHLEAFRTVHAMDRRGRGSSGDSVDWELDREVDDVVAVVEAVSAEAGTPTDLLGHSFGGLLALRAAARSDRVRRLVTYEAAVNEPPQSPALLARLTALLQEGRRDEAVAMVMRDVVQMPEAEIAILREQPTWPSRVAAAHTLPRELGVSLNLDPREVAGLRVPTLVIVGADSPAFVQEGTRMVAGALPECVVVVLEGQQHVADQLIPDEFAAHVREFLTGRRARDSNP